MPKHKFKELIDATNGNTAELKKEIAAYSGLSVRMIHLLYSGKQENLTIDNATIFLEFFNAKRTAEDKMLDLSDIYIQRNIVDKAKFLSNINMTK